MNEARGKQSRTRESDMIDTLDSSTNTSLSCSGVTADPLKVNMVAVRGRSVTSSGNTLKPGSASTASFLPGPDLALLSAWRSKLISVIVSLIHRRACGRFPLFSSTKVLEKVLLVSCVPKSKTESSSLHLLVFVFVFVFVRVSVIE